MTPRTSGILVRPACGIVLLAVAQFVVIQGYAMTRYPGGHEWNHQAPGYDFWRNTLSDLGKTKAYNDQPNPVSRLSRVSATVFLLSIGLIWLVLPRLFPRRKRLGLLVRVLGLLSLGGMIGLGFTPADKFHVAHAVANGFAAIPGLAAYLLSWWGMTFSNNSKTCPKFLPFAGVVLMILALIHFGQYVAHFWLGFAWTRACPLMQRLAFLAGLVWITLTAGIVFRRAK
jgi:hypothetical membrane protein